MKNGGGKPLVQNNGMFVLEIILLVALCVLHSLSAGHYADFYPINGTFQNFNPVRRLLAGQIPYRDFQDYLGLGHLYVGTLTTLIFGGTYKDSLSAFSFLSLFSFALILLTIFYAVLRTKECAVALTNIVLLSLLIQPLFFTNGVAMTPEILEAMKSALGTGNSARFLRGMIIPIVCMAFVIVYKRLLQKKSDSQNKKLCVIVGLIAGAAFLWGNDYGISCWLCLTIMTFWGAYCEKRSIKIALKAAGAELISSCISCVVFAEFFTLGHAKEYFVSMLGTGDYQRWYFYGGKSYFLYDVDFSYIMLVQAFIVLLYLYKMLKAGDKDRAIRFGIPAFANMVCFCAANEYRLLSGGYLRQVALTVLFATVIVEILIRFFAVAEKNKREVLITVSAVVGMACVLSMAKDEFVFRYETDKTGRQIESMGGNVNTYGADLLRTKKFLNGESFFATYASAQEVVCNTFQPSGSDYIIHVLGDSARDKYMTAFHVKDFQYAATIKDSTQAGFSSWEVWASRANWFFYRELYQNWRPIYANSYEVYWERKEEDRSVVPANIRAEQIGGDAIRLTVEAGPNISGIADVLVDYNVKKKAGLFSKLIFLTNLKVQNSGVLYKRDFYESNYLPPKGVRNIPITIENGRGEAILTANPRKRTTLELRDLKCENVYTTPYEYIEVAGVASDADCLRIKVPNFNRYAVGLKNAKEAVINNLVYEILETMTTEKFIYVSLNASGINSGGIVLQNGNFLRIR